MAWKLEWVNMGEVLKGLKEREEKLKSLPKIGRQMGVLALNEIRPLCNRKTGNWQGSWTVKITQKSTYSWEVKVYSPGVFNGKGTNYGAIQEARYHPGEIGFNRAKPAMSDWWQQQVHGMMSNQISGTSGDDFEFGAMGGMM